MGFVNDCLWEYRDNLNIIELKKEELAELQSVSSQKYSTFPPSDGNISDPIQRVFYLRQKLEHEIKAVERKTKPVTLMLESLSVRLMREYQMRKILEYRFFAHEPIDFVIRKLAISERTYRRRCREIRSIAHKYFYECK